MADQYLPQGFLCSRHRAWLSRRPREALLCWQRFTEEAQRLISAGEWSTALRFAGSALEAAQLMVRDARHCDGNWLSRHAASQDLFEMLAERLLTATSAVAAEPQLGAAPMAMRTAASPTLH
ncbi:MAG: hypothetical protein AAGI24_10840 [Pseudomonadota bacterium]